MKFSSLPIINLLGKKGRSAALFVFALLLGFSIFGGALILTSLRNGLHSLELRLGADIVVVPYEARTKVSADTILNQGNRTYFYMSRSNLEKVASIEGVERLSPQVYMCSMNAGCCSVSLQLIGFDPETDFTIQPWIKDSSKNTELGLLDVYIGNNITVNEDGFIRLYGNSCKIKGQFAATGSTLDNAVYMNYDTVKKLIESSFEKGLNQYEIFDTETVISSVFVKVKQGENIEEVAKRIQENVEGVSVATSKSMVSGIAENLKNVSKTANAFIVIFFFLSFFMTLLIFLMMINERKKESMEQILKIIIIN